MARSRDSELWEAATVIALGCATLLALAYLLSLWKPLAPARRSRVMGGFFARHADDPAPAPARPAPAAPAAAPQPMTAPAPVAKPQTPAPDPDGLSPEDRAALAAAFGGWDPSKFAVAGKTLFELGASPAGASLVRRPKVVSYLLNNETVIKTFMGLDRVQRLCRDPGALQRYWADRGDPKGFGRDTASFRRTLDTPGSAEAVLNSRLANAMLDRCRAIPAVVENLNSMIVVARANPDLAALGMDPRFQRAASASPHLKAVMGKMASAFVAAQFATPR